jgi:hypothetical protein
MHTKRRFIAAAAVALAYNARAASDAESGLQVRPVLVDGRATTGATLGLEYKYARKWARSGSTGDSGPESFDFSNAVLWDALVEVRGSGTAAASSERNPNKLLDLAVNARYDRMPSEKWSAGAGVTLKAETDQGFDERQFVYGLQLRGFVNNPIGHGWAIAYLNFARVEPRGDAERTKALGADLDPYRRWDAEIVLHRDLKGSIGSLKLMSIEAQYRHYQEMSPLPVVRSAGLNQHRLGTLRLRINEDYFIAYSRGRLPFDKQSDRTIKIGWTYKFK